MSMEDGHSKPEANTVEEMCYQATGKQSGPRRPSIAEPSETHRRKHDKPR